MLYVLIKLLKTWKNVDKCKIFQKLTEIINSSEMLNYCFWW
jgi:hypothetical protein